MRKRFVLFSGIIGTVLVGLFLVISVAKADTAPSWINSELTIQKEADTQSLPATLFGGNIDCVMESSACSISTPYGAVTNGAIRLNGSNKSIPVLSFLENKPRVMLIPNSNTVISYLTTPVFGFYFYFNNYLSVNKTVLPGTTQEAFQINRSPDGKLADKANNRLAADTESMSFSANGKWMVVSVPNVAMIRVDLDTFEALPFAEKFTYGIGLPPAPKTAITNDGRFAVVASKDQSRFKLYDLNTCAGVPGTISGPVACQSRDLKPLMQSKVPAFDFVSRTRFLNDDLLSIYASYKVDTTLKTARFLLSNTSITSQIDYLALGESYISGEGAFNYQAGTDIDTNQCHLSLVSYPYLIGRDLNFSSYHSVACSGAVMDDITNSRNDYKGQVDNRKGKPRLGRSPEEIDSIFASFMPGYVNQSDFVGRYRPKIMNLSIAGNDIGFSAIVKKCALPWNFDNCYESYEDRLELVRLINSKFPDLVDTYTKVKNQSPVDSRIYVIGYPQIAKPGGDCAVNVRLNNDELIFAQQLIAYLDLIIEKATAKAGVYYVDTQDAFDGHRLCEAGPGSVAVNGLTAGNDIPDSLGGPIANESYHPNDFGHLLLENKILAVTKNFTEPMPTPNPNAILPSESGLEILNAPKQNRAVNFAQYNDDMTNDILFQGVSSELKVQGLDYSLTPSGNYRAELRSEPTNLGNFSSDSSGNLNAQFQIPDDIPIGFHTMHVYGTNLAGENIDIYKDVYVASNVDDYDGDGIDNTSDPCFFIEPAGQDYDQDGIDDGCDGTIDQPPQQQAINTEQESKESTPTNMENQNPTAVLSSTTNNGAQPPTANPQDNSAVDVLSSENNDKTIEAQVQSVAITNNPGTAEQDNDKFALNLEVFKQQWPLLTAISVTVIASLGLLYKKVLPA